ncbi:MAG: type II toxin-antitoxin system prevent-host-death family antitoxin [Bifidobacteriaceae bacterium]|nr:type II toxin-antitoxin system prevent-host-death family antitoxin [Bifidobacteriaceae bacterium]
MRTLSATAASRNFSRLLDAVEAGESVTVTRGNRPVAELRPARRATGRELRAALAAIPPPDRRFCDQIAQAVGGLSQQNADPWADD